MEIQKDVGTTLQLRIGLNSGQVIAGEIGSGKAGYTAIGQQVGMAQRMESVAPPGGVMLSESTARLVENGVVLGDPELVQIKGSDEPVRARRLLALGVHPGRRTESSLSDAPGSSIPSPRSSTRRWAEPAVWSLLGPPGIGKSRLIREIVAVACSRLGSSIQHILRVACDRYSVSRRDAIAARGLLQRGIDEL